MKISEFIRDDDAVSPVIGVILMVAITVILAAVIGTFVLGLGDQVQESSPQASFDFDFDKSVGGGSDSWDDTDTIKITHEGGDSIPVGRLSIVLGSASMDSDGTTSATSPEFASWSGDVSAGSVETLTAEDISGTQTIDAAGEVPLSDFGSDEEIRVVWTGESGDQSATLGRATLP